MNQLTDGFYAMSMRLLDMLRDRGGAGPGRGRTVLVTSARAGEGKTYVSRMIASCMAELSTDPVLLVDASVERPSLHMGFGIPNEAGFTDCMTAGAFEQAATCAVAPGNLFVLTAGSTLKPGLLFKPQVFETFLSQSSERFGLVLIDGGTLATTGCMPHHVDGVIMVVDSSRTRREVVQGVMGLAKADRNRYLGAVLNKRVQYIPRSLYRYF